jgi:hypothetical protein
MTAEEWSIKLRLEVEYGRTIPFVWGLHLKEYLSPLSFLRGYVANNANSNKPHHLDKF